MATTYDKTNTFTLNSALLNRHIRRGGKQWSTRNERYKIVQNELAALNPVEIAALADGKPVPLDAGNTVNLPTILSLPQDQHSVSTPNNQVVLASYANNEAMTENNGKVDASFQQRLDQQLLNFSPFPNAAPCNDMAGATQSMPEAFNCLTNGGSEYAACPIPLPPGFVPHGVAYSDHFHLPKRDVSSSIATEHSFMSMTAAYQPTETRIFPQQVNNHSPSLPPIPSRPAIAEYDQHPAVPRSETRFPLPNEDNCRAWLEIGSESTSPPLPDSNSSNLQECRRAAMIMYQDIEEEMNRAVSHSLRQQEVRREEENAALQELAVKLAAHTKRRRQSQRSASEGPEFRFAGSPSSEMFWPSPPGSSCPDAVIEETDDGPV